MHDDEQAHPVHGYTLLDPPGRFLGLLPDLLIEEKEITVESGDTLVCYSDGVTDVVRPGDGEVMVGVRDHGPGISTDDQETLFQPFQRLETRSEMKGIGLGLVVCKHLVEAHSGRIWVESKLGEGSIFYFTLPSTVSKDNL